MTNLYKMRLGRNGAWESQALNEGILRVGFGIAANLHPLITKDEIRFYLEKDNPKLTQRQINIRAFQLDLFVNKMSEGDFVLVDLKTRKTMAIGMIVGKYNSARPGRGREAC